jgi:hypothetical protein
MSFNPDSGLFGCGQPAKLRVIAWTAFVQVAPPPPRQRCELAARHAVRVDATHRNRLIGL